MGKTVNLGSESTGTSTPSTLANLKEVLEPAVALAEAAKIDVTKAFKGFPSVGVAESAFTSALDFSSNKKIDDHTQTGNIAFALTAASHVIGNTISVKIFGNASGTCTFSTAFKVFGSFDNTKENYLTFYCHSATEIWVTVLNGATLVVPEPSGVNLLANSEEFQSAPYTKGANLTIGNYGSLDPLGTMKAKTMTCNTVEFWTARLMLNNGVPVTANQVYTLSLFVKPEELRQIAIYLESSGGGYAGRCLYNFDNNSKLNLIGNSANIVAAANGWSRIDLTFTAPATESLNFYPDWQDADAPGERLHLFGLQLNPGATPDTYTKKP